MVAKWAHKASHRTFLELEILALYSVLPENEVLACKELESAFYRFHCTESMFCVIRVLSRPPRPSGPAQGASQAARTSCALFGFARPKWS